MTNTINWKEILYTFIDLGRGFIDRASEIMAWAFEPIETLLGTFAPIEMFLGGGVIIILGYSIIKFIIPV